jgi:hypothetical protein
MPSKKFEEEEIQANLLPVMNIMFLLIPALLLAMEFASMASINVSPPRFTTDKTEDTKPDDPPKVKPLNLKVFVMEDGYRVSADGQQEGRRGRQGDRLHLADDPAGQAGGAAQRLRPLRLRGARGAR